MRPTDYRRAMARSAVTDVNSAVKKSRQKVPKKPAEQILPYVQEAMAVEENAEAAAS